MPKWPILRLSAAAPAEVAGFPSCCRDAMPGCRVSRVAEPPCSDSATSRQVFRMPQLESTAQELPGSAPLLRFCKQSVVDGVPVNDFDTPGAIATPLKANAVPGIDPYTMEAGAAP